MDVKKDRLTLEEDSEKYKTLFPLCLVCQTKTNESLVQKTTYSSTDTLITNNEEIRVAFIEMQEQFDSSDMNQRFKLHDEQSKDRPMFVFSRQYMAMIIEMLVFLKSVRTEDWYLHLTSLNSFCKYFFAFDRLNYARLVTL